MLSHDATKLLVKQILLRFGSYDWSLQGFGMLRTYLDPEHRYRLHIWDSRYRVPNVSLMHTHPWDFTSLIVAGRITNKIYEPNPGGPQMMMKQLIKCGPGGCAVGEPEPVELMLTSSMPYRGGQSYTEKADQIHMSLPADGTVTLVERVFREDVDHAFVFFPQGQKWVSAEPRQARPNEVSDITRLALARWFQ